MEQEDWIQHLAEIRKRLIIVAGWFTATLCAGLYLSPALLRYIKSQPGAGRSSGMFFPLRTGR
ncbi:hypothetical protein LJK88_50275 [Paenibacillus sp. P26]|nr:hypothetical protein LJK88_50275 [Paenibacillus sp. P26]UUZ97857.1 hypothetical protein LJK87_38090 [Paenibacillus sp. P25]